MVIDENIYRKKLHRGPFFEIYKDTSLKNKKSFNDHCSDISKGTMEEICFRAICTLLAKENCDLLHFDNGILSQPDVYSRSGADIIMMEYKDNIFKEALFKNATFDEIKNYIDEKFVKSDKGKPKGITQLYNQIKILMSGGYKFDPDLDGIIAKNEKVNIYPIICYSDFMFGMPGINDYINHLFQSLSLPQSSNFLIHPVIMINIEALFDYSFRGGSFYSLPTLLNKYLDILKDEKSKLDLQFSTRQFVRTMAGFDEIYEAGYLNSVFASKYDVSLQEELYGLIGLSKQEINEVL